MNNIKEKINITDSLGNKVSGILSIPKGSSIVAVLSHGFTSNRNSNLYMDLEKELNKAGIGTVKYEYYGHGPVYGHETRGVSSDVTVTKCVESLRAVVKYVRNKGNYRIGLVGSSFGGLVSLVVASTDKNIEFLALRSPVTHPMEFWNERVRGPENKIYIDEWKKNDSFHYNREGENYTLKYDFWEDLKKYNSTKLAKGITCATFVGHGDKDTIVPIKYSKSFAKMTGINLNVIKGADHHYSTLRHYLKIKNMIMDFIIQQAKRKIKAVIFDWNGVITDSLRLDHEIFLKECTRKGLKVPRTLNFYRNMFNDNVYVCLEKIGFHVDGETEKFYRQLYMEGLWKTRPFHGIKPMLKSLKKKYKLAIITSNYTRAVETFFKTHGIKEFDIILSSDDNQRKEKKIKMLLNRFSITKDEVIFAGDTISDIKVSKASGIKSIATSWGYQSRNKLKKYKPDYIADNPQGIIKILERLENNG